MMTDLFTLNKITIILELPIETGLKIIKARGYNLPTMLKKKLLLLTGTVLLSAITLKVTAQTVNSPAVNEKAARKWVKSREWANGMKQDVAPSVNATEFYRQYHANPKLWEEAFAFIREHNLDTMTVGKYPIDGDLVYASITENPSKEFEQSKWESHHNYIDLQYVIRGKEKIGVLPVTQATVSVPYNPEKDNANYTSDAGKYYIAVPGTFYLFFPTEAHRPVIKVEGYPVVKKLVIKVHSAQ